MVSTSFDTVSSNFKIGKEIFLPFVMYFLSITQKEFCKCKLDSKFSVFLLSFDHVII
jgi:hypothetical protein